MYILSIYMVELNLRQEQIRRSVSKVGNGAHIFVPKEWIGQEIILIKPPKLSLKEEVFKILSPYLKDVLGVYLVGSYARGEQTERSDVDVLVITNNIDRRIEKKKYDIFLVSEKILDEKMKKNIFPLLPMMIEAKPIINKELLNKYINSPLTKKNLKWYIDTTKSAMRVVKEYIKLAEEMEEKVSDAASYSLILRLRTIYIINCLKNGEIWTKRKFLDLIKKISGSLIAYERYLASKNNNAKEYKLPIEEAKKLMDYNNKKIRGVEKWLKEKKN